MGFRKIVALIVTLVPVLSLGSTGISLSGQQAVPEQSADGVWQFVAERPAGAIPRPDLEGAYAMARFSKASFDAVVAVSPRDAEGRFELMLPMPDGTLARFAAWPDRMLSPALAAAFPEIQTFAAQGIDDPSAHARFGWTTDGFHAIVLGAGGSTYVDPYERGNAEHHVIFRKQDHRHEGDAMQCLLGMGMSPMLTESLRSQNAFPFSHGVSLRTFRLALAATGEYTAAAGGTVQAALNRMTATINRVNAVYERDLAVRLELNTGPNSTDRATELIYTNGSTDPYTDTQNGVSLMLTQNQNNIDSVMTSGGYDIGHVFGTAGGGIAGLGVVCLNGNKARGVTSLPNPTGDVFDIDYVAHEIGHQFGGNHTFNSVSSSCGGSNRSGSHAYEVGSGSTIQSYSGICGVENLQQNSNDYFHVESLDEMTAFLTSGSGASCGTNVANGNTAPVVSTGSSYTIPAQTPFMLTATASDANGDSLTYTWEQFDLGSSTSSVASASTDSGSGPLFRSYSPSTSATRFFPSLTYILSNSNIPPTTYTCGGSTCLTGEALPNTNRTMNFQVTVRDNRAGGGAITTASTAVTVTTGAGPFAVTAPNTGISVSGGSSMTVTWNPAGTATAPVNASTVEIALSTDGGQTFPTVLAASEANDGSTAVTVPNTPTNAARVRVKGVGNIFFDVSNVNFVITAGVNPTPTPTPSPTATPTPTPTPSSCPGSAPVPGWLCVDGGWLPPDHPLASPTPTPTPSPTPTPTPTPTATPTPTPSSCPGSAPVSNWLCVDGGWLPPDHPLATSAPTPTPTPTGTPTPTPTPTPTATPTPSSCPGSAPVSNWLCVNGGWLPPDHPLATSSPTPTPTPTSTPTPTPTPTPSSCPGSTPVAGWLCINGGWVPPNHPLAGGGRALVPPARQ